MTRLKPSCCVSANQGVTYEPCTLDQQDRLGCTADQHLGYLEQPGERQHRGLQKIPGHLRGLALSKHQPARWPFIGRHRTPFRPDAGGGCQGGGHPEEPQPGQRANHGQLAGSDDKRPRLLRDPAARWQRGLYPQRPVHPQQ